MAAKVSNDSRVERTPRKISQHEIHNREVSPQLSDFQIRISKLATLQGEEENPMENLAEEL
jgi:hypothetical protein